MTKSRSVPHPETRVKRGHPAFPSFSAVFRRFPVFCLFTASSFHEFPCSSVRNEHNFAFSRVPRVCPPNFRSATRLFHPDPWDFPVSSNLRTFSSDFPLCHPPFSVTGPASGKRVADRDNQVMLVAFPPGFSVCHPPFSVSGLRAGAGWQTGQPVVCQCQAVLVAFPSDFSVCHPPLSVAGPASETSGLPSRGRQRGIHGAYHVSGPVARIRLYFRQSAYLLTPIAAVTK